jgi:adenosylcobinamide-GDP ribazoletransferase
LPSLPSPGRTPDWLRDLAGAWVFYSVLPAWPWPRPRFERIARFAPWIGLVIGASETLLWVLCEGWLPGSAQVALVLALGVVLTGGVHLDGLMDTADGLGAGERALEAMKDSRVGASGVLALTVLLLLRAAALLTLSELGSAEALGLALIGSAVWGRTAPLVAMQGFAYLRPSGTAGFHLQHWQGLGREGRPALLLLLLLGLTGSALGWPWQLWLGLPPALAVPIWLGRRLGGHSGDTYGASLEWSQALALLLISLALALP